MDSKISHSILDTIGQTPIIPLSRLVPSDSAMVYGKYEAANPSLSIKDRIAFAMIEKGLQEGFIKSDTTIVDATAGNTGVALALVCAVKKLKLHLFMPEDASLERRKMFQGFGAQLTVTPKSEGVSGSISRALEYLKTTPNTFSVNQFENPANPMAHAQTTAQEILADFPNGVDALVLGVGTGGSLTGVGGELKKKNPAMQIIAVEPKNSSVLSGGQSGSHKIQQLGHGFIPKNLKKDLIDRILTVSDSEAYLMTRRLSQKEGMLLGMSSGANVHAAMQIASELGAGKKILTFLCDAGQRYFSIVKSFKGE